MSRTFSAFAFALVLAVVLTGLAESDPRPKPPHAERLEGASPTTTLSPPVPLEESPPDDPGIGTTSPPEPAYMAPIGTSEACDGFVIPAGLVWRESRCQRLGDTGGPYIGAYQITRSYWEPDEICAGLDWNDPAQEDECARRLWNDGAGAHHWGA